MPENERALERIARKARHTEWRLRFRELCRPGLSLLCVCLVYAVGALTFVKVAHPSPATQSRVLLFGLIPVCLLVGGLAWALFKKRAPFSGALTLDRHHGLSDRLTTALSFRRVPVEQRSPFMLAAIEDAAAHASKLSPRRAAPIPLPRELLVVALLLCGLFAVSLFEVRTVRRIPPPPSVDAMIMTADDIELFREVGEELQANVQDPEALSATRQFNQLIEDIAARRLDRREVFERLTELERQLATSGEAEAKALEESLKSLAEELEKSDLSKPIAEALNQKKLSDAERAMRELAEALRKKQKPPSKAELEKLRAALEKAGKKSEERQNRIEQRRLELEEEKKRLLKKKSEADGGATPKLDQELQKLERQLERLERERSQGRAAQSELSQLDRELAEAARKLMQESGSSAEHLERGAEDINRMAKKQLSDEEKEALKKKIEELRELIRQQGKGGQQRIERLQKFGQRARGQQGGGSDETSGPGKPGPGELRFGPGGTQSIPIPGLGEGAGPGQQGSASGSSGQGEKPGSGPASGSGWGSGHDDNLRADKSEIEGRTKDVSAVAADTGQGAASSEVIYGAAQRGFVGRGYKQIYTDYKTVAEDVMTQEDIPPGYRFYVQRYFQLIRPRD